MSDAPDRHHRRAHDDGAEPANLDTVGHDSTGRWRAYDP